MEPACLKIKFTPLLQEARKSSEKCCLEIVPEVSCIQNFDKLTWRQESNFIEHSIPMTYKIILRKWHVQDSSNEIVKTYHSCVDLLLPSSKSNVELASGDISRIISDTFILSKIPIPKNNDINLTKLDKKFSEIIQRVKRIDDATVEATESTVIEIEEVVLDDEVKSDPLQLNKILCDKLTSTQNILSMSSNDLNPERAVNISRQLLSKPKLSLSPICSVNTQDNDSLTFTSKASKAIICKMLGSQTNLLPPDCVSNLRQLTNENKISNIISEIGPISTQNSSLEYCFNERSPPEVRIAQYVHYMERELLPLTITLDQLISKCAVLGIYDVPCKIIQSRSNNLIIYKSVCMYNNHITTEVREKTISNRAVYSVVFEG